MGTGHGLLEEGELEFAQLAHEADVGGKSFEGDFALLVYRIVFLFEQPDLKLHEVGINEVVRIEGARSEAMLAAVLGTDGLAASGFRAGGLLGVSSVGGDLCGSSHSRRKSTILTTVYAIGFGI